MVKILRVATLNNFNFTDQELEQLDDIQSKAEDFSIFVNSNSIPKIRGNYPCIITVNPKLDEFIEPKGKISLIKAIRIKYIAGGNNKVNTAFKQSVQWAKSKKIPILITYMRFNSRELMEKYTINQSNYVWTKSYFRQINKKQFKGKIFNYCDLKGGGCPACKNCAKLSHGIDTDQIFSINLSTSGSCKYNCPGCYAKRIELVFNFAYDKINQNKKMKGKM